MGNTRWGLEMKKPKTQDQWAESIAEHKEGVIILERRMYNSPAFRELSKKRTHVLVLLVALNQVFWEKKKNSKKGRRTMANGGIVYLTQNELKERGIKSGGTIAEAKKRLVELGFLDVLETGSVNNAGKFQISERWRQYPNGDYEPKDQKLPGRCLYENYSLKNPEHPIHRKRREKNLHSKIELTSTLFDSKNEWSDIVSIQ